MFVCFGEPTTTHVRVGLIFHDLLWAGRGVCYCPKGCVDVVQGASGARVGEGFEQIPVDLAVGQIFGQAA